MTNSSSQAVVVLGGSGFLGSHVADELSNRAFSVRVFDKTPSRYLNSSQEMIIGDVTDTAAVNEAVSGCDYVFNFAAVAGLAETDREPVNTAQINVLGTVASLEAARAAGVKRYVLASSVYVYSSSGGIYKASKQSAEAFVEAYQQAYGLPFTILRYGSLYGRRADNGNTIARFVRECVEQGTMTYSGTRNAVREYIHVRDAARLSVDILDKEYEQRHILLTGAERLPVREVMEMIAEISPQKPEIEIREADSDLHYSMSPYNYQPRLGHKLVARDYVDLGQGILDCFEELFETKTRPDVKEAS